MSDFLLSYRKFKYPFLLASGSKFRLKLLQQIMIKPDEIFSPNINENCLNKKELPSAYCKRIAQNKAFSAKIIYPNHLILAADTVIAAGRRILHKTQNPDQAKQYLELLSGRRHRAYTTICVTSPCGKQHIRQKISIVKFKSLDSGEINDYLNSNQWIDCAGAYTISGIAASFINFISGSESNIIGLPLFDTNQILKQYFI